MVKAVIGLGNPGREYDGTRHNAGFAVLDELARRTGVRLKRSWLLRARWGKVRDPAEGAGVALVQPQTFVNRSGVCVARVARAERLAPEEMLVVVDDADLALGQIRLRRQGGAGGHNGLRSVIQELGGEGFPRLRVGVGPRPAGSELVAYVLGRFASDERSAVERAVAAAADAAWCAVREGVETAMNRYNPRGGAPRGNAGTAGAEGAKR